ncbi:MAG: surface lipoprotein assembly modifier [Oleibacter sp.]|nr:surface lipoprotein assembly modifier [Thalassolituus sp.]
MAVCPAATMSSTGIHTKKTMVCAMVFFACLLVVSLPAYAGLELGVSVGAEYDSNILPSTDITVSEGDWSTVYGAYLGASGEFPITKSSQWNKPLAWQARYDISDTRWTQASQYNSVLQSGLFRLSHNGAQVNSDVSMLIANASVDGQDFLSLYRISPGAGALLSPHWYMRGQIDLAQKTFAQFSARDSDQLGVKGTLCGLLNGTQHYVSLQLGMRQENAADDQYGYSQWQGRLRWKYRLNDIRFNLASTYEQRNYDALWPTISAIREDRRLRFSAGVEVTLPYGFSWQTSAGRDIYQSNYPSADYQQYRLESTLHWDY